MSNQKGQLKMANSKYQESFFEELETAAKRLSVASDGIHSTEIKALFDDLKRTFSLDEQRSDLMRKSATGARVRRDHHA